MNEQIKQRITQLNNGEVPIGYEKTDFGIFPCDWVTDKKLKDLGSFGKGKGLPGDKMTTEGVPCVGYGDIYMKYNHFHFEEAQTFVDEKTASESQPIHKGTLLFTGTGETADEIGKCVCYNGDETIYAGGDIITFVADKVNPLFLAYQQYQEFSLRKKASFGQGHSVVHIQRENLEKLNVAYPKSTEEQSKIAEILMKWDEAIELQEAYLELILFKKSYLIKHLMMPQKHWISIEMQAVGELYQPMTISEIDLTDTGYTVYGANGEIGFYHTYNHEQSEIAITCRGSTCGQVTFTKPKSWITGNAMVFKVDENKFDKNFLYYYCCSLGFKKIISGSGQPQIIRQAFQKFLFHIPADKSEQRKIANLLVSVDEYVNVQTEKLNILKKQRKALQQYLLNGIVRV